jgi:hypothetical protein
VQSVTAVVKKAGKKKRAPESSRALVRPIKRGLNNKDRIAAVWCQEAGNFF